MLSFGTISQFQSSLERSSVSAELFDDEISPFEVVKRDLSYDEFFRSFLIPNRPCFLETPQAVVSNWKISKEWLDQDTGELMKEYLTSQYGTDEVSVADCNDTEYDAHRKSDYRLSDYLKYLHNSNHQTNILYLKDYHFSRLHPDVSLYDCPVYFTSDWLNEFCDDKRVDDYKFVYLGPKGSWTSFHADVLRSYSWSANVKGRKLWILYQPGSEELLKDRLGNLPSDVNTPEYKHTSHPSHKFRHEVIQETGQIIFVPSGWHHQVINLEETLSVNHNWFNGCNIERCWFYLKSTLGKVETEISDCKDMENWSEHCQVLLRAYLGFNYIDFISILQHIATKRLKTSNSRLDSEYPKRNAHDIFDMTAISRVLKHMISSELSDKERNLCAQLLSCLQSALQNDNG